MLETLPFDLLLLVTVQCSVLKINLLYRCKTGSDKMPFETDLFSRNGLNKISFMFHLIIGSSVYYSQNFQFLHNSTFICLNFRQKQQNACAESCVNRR